MKNLLYILGGIAVLLILMTIVFAVPVLLICAAVQLFKAGFIFFGVLVALVSIGILSLVSALFD